MINDLILKIVVGLIVAILAGLVVALISYHVFGIGKKKTNKSESNFKAEDVGAGRDVIVGNNINIDNRIINKKNNVLETIFDYQTMKQKQTSLLEVSYLETGKSISSLRDDTYCFAYGYSIQEWFKNESSCSSCSSCLDNNNRFMFEIQKINDECFLVGYAGEESCANIDKENEITISALPIGVFQKIVTIPIVRIEKLQYIKKQKREDDSRVIDFGTIKLKSFEIFLWGIRHTNQNNSD